MFGLAGFRDAGGTMAARVLLCALALVALVAVPVAARLSDGTLAAFRSFPRLSPFAPLPPPSLAAPMRWGVYIACVAAARARQLATPVFSPNLVVLSVNETTTNVTLCTVPAAVDSGGTALTYTLITDYPTVPAAHSVSIIGGHPSLSMWFSAPLFPAVLHPGGHVRVYHCQCVLILHPGPAAVHTHCDRDKLGDPTPQRQLHH